MLKLAFITYLRPLLDLSRQIWTQEFDDKIESVQSFFTQRIRGLEKLSFGERLNILGLETLPAQCHF